MAIAGIKKLGDLNSTETSLKKESNAEFLLLRFKNLIKKSD